MCSQNLVPPRPSKDQINQSSPRRLPWCAALCLDGHVTQKQQACHYSWVYICCHAAAPAPCAAAVLPAGASPSVCRWMKSSMSGLTRSGASSCDRERHAVWFARPDGALVPPWRSMVCRHPPPCRTTRPSRWLPTCGQWPTPGSSTKLSTAAGRAAAGSPGQPSVVPHTMAAAMALPQPQHCKRGVYQCSCRLT